MQKADWQIVQFWPGFVVEVNCNGGGHRRVYPDGRIELIDEGKQGDGYSLRVKNSPQTLHPHTAHSNEENTA